MSNCHTVIEERKKDWEANNDGKKFAQELNENRWNKKLKLHDIAEKEFSSKESIFKMIFRKKFKIFFVFCFL